MRSAGRSSPGLQRVELLRGEAAGAGGGGSLGTAVSCDRLSLGSHNDSFNSEEGFGSPVKQRCECCCVVWNRVAARSAEGAAA